MSEMDALVLIAELSVAPIAAAGIVTAIGGRGRVYSPGDRLRILGLIETAATALVVCLFAIVLVSASLKLPFV